MVEKCIELAVPLKDAVEGVGCSSNGAYVLQWRRLVVEYEDVRVAVVVGQGPRHGIA